MDEPRPSPSGSLPRRARGVRPRVCLWASLALHAAAGLVLTLTLDPPAPPALERGLAMSLDFELPAPVLPQEPSEPEEIEQVEPLEPVQVDPPTEPPDAPEAPLDEEVLEAPPDPPALAEPITVPVIVPRVRPRVAPSLPPPAAPAPVSSPPPAPPPTPARRPPPSAAGGGAASPLVAPDPPAHPAVRRLRQRTTALLLLTIDRGGQIVRVEVQQSSGLAVLDEHARQWVLTHWRFAPRAAPVRTLLPVYFVP